MGEKLPDGVERGVQLLLRALAEPFDPRDVKFKPQAVKGNRALALAYVDVRCIMDRLDTVLGPDGWQDSYQVLSSAEGAVKCRLAIRVDGRWIKKVDVGGPSEQPDGGDRMKAAFSDALKRTAVKWGIGRYLYRLPQQWADYDPQKRQFTQPPRLPDWAMPKGSGRAPDARPNRDQRPPAGQAGNGKPAGSGGYAGLPTSGADLHARLRTADADLAAQGRCPIGALLAHVTQAGVNAGYGADVSRWAGGAAMELAIQAAKEFKAAHPHREEGKPTQQQQTPPPDRPGPKQTAAEWVKSHSPRGYRKLTNQQAADVGGKLREAGGKVGDFLEHFGIKFIIDLPQTCMPYALELIRARKAQRPAA